MALPVENLAPLGKDLTPQVTHSSWPNVLQTIFPVFLLNMGYFSENLGHLCEVCTGIFGVIQHGVASHVSRVEGRFWSPRQWIINVIGERCHLCSLLLPRGEEAYELTGIIDCGNTEEPLKYLVTTNEGPAASVTGPKRFRLTILFAGESSLGRKLFLIYPPSMFRSILLDFANPCLNTSSLR